MGKWNVERVWAQHTRLDTGTHFGTNFRVFFRLRYNPSILSRFVEPPRLDWHEKILMKEHHNGTWWEFETNMYTHKPTSNTLGIWMARYYEAYNTAAGLPMESIQMKGSSTLLDKAGARVNVHTLGAGIVQKKDKAAAVRSYLKKKGGILVLEIHDIPSLALPMGVGDHKERLLCFTCGVVGGSQRVRAEQYLDADQAAPRANWQREFRLTWQKNWGSRGLRKVAAGPGVAMPSGYAPHAGLGEYW